MERAETLVGSPGLPELNVVGDEVDDLGAVPHLRDGIPGHSVVLPGEPVSPRSDRPMVRDEDRFVELDRVAVGHARHEIGDAPRGFLVAAGSVLRRKAIGVFEEVRVERADDVLRPLRVRVFVERSVHLTEEELPQRVGGLLHMGRDGDEAGRYEVSEWAITSVTSVLMRRECVAPSTSRTSGGTSSIATRPARSASSRSWLI